MAKDGGDAPLELDHRAVGPQRPPHLLPADQIAWAAQQNGQHLKRLIGHSDPHPVPAKLPRSRIELERPEANAASYNRTVHEGVAANDCNTVTYVMYVAVRGICFQSAGLYQLL